MIVNIRDARKTDYSFVMDAFREAHGEILANDPDLYMENYPQTPPWKYRAGLVLRDVFKSKAMCLKIAEIDGKPVGVVFAKKAHRNPWSIFNEHLLLDNIFVLPNYRRQGVALELIKATMEWARAAGYDYVEGEISLRNEASRGLCKKAGLGERQVVASAAL